MGTNHLSVGYESSQLWVRIVWVRNVRGYETSVGTKRPVSRENRASEERKCTRRSRNTWKWKGNGRGENKQL